MPTFLTFPDPLLQRQAPARPVDAAMREAGLRLRVAAREVQAYGLAATHLGMIEPLIVVSLSQDRTARDYRIFYNPQIMRFSDERIVDAEGSVSMPGIEAPIERSLWIDLTFDDKNGVSHTDQFENFVARVIQHELDQMNGIFFLSRLSRLKRDTAIRKFNKITAHKPATG